MTQLPLGFDHKPQLTRDDFLVADCNRQALDWLDRWPDWPAPALALVGPAGCGKTHLAGMFASLDNVKAVTLGALTTQTPPDLLGQAQALVIDDADTCLSLGLEEKLFHLYNLAKEAGSHLLLTARDAPARWSVHLPDLKSRLNAAVVVEIGAPDDALILQVLVKLFNDRQIKVEEEVLTYMLARMERSFEAARKLVEAIDTQSLTHKRRVTVPLVRTVMDE